MSADTEIEQQSDKSGAQCAPASKGMSLDGQIEMKRILVPVDFSETSRKAVRYARRFAEIYGAKVTLFHVVDFADIDRVALRLGPLAQERMESEALTRAQDLINQLADQEIGGIAEHDSDIVAGLTTDAIVEKAKRCEADLILVGVHSERVIKHTIIGSTAERVVRLAPCPVLVVRDHEQEFIDT
jgi:nucleotide-binding universal stress UspA family protein